MVFILQVLHGDFEFVQNQILPNPDVPIVKDLNNCLLRVPLQHHTLVLKQFQNPQPLSLTRMSTTDTTTTVMVVEEVLAMVIAPSAPIAND